MNIKNTNKRAETKSVSFINNNSSHRSKIFEITQKTYLKENKALSNYIV